MTTALNDFKGNAIYLDTMIAYIFLRGMTSDARPFFERIESGEFLAYTSVLTFDELAYRLLLAFIKDHHGGSPLNRLRSEEEKMITEFAPTVVDLLRRLRAYPNLTILDATASDLDVMNDAMAKYHLRPRDALHHAAMQRVSCFDLASNDQHFDRIPHIRRFTL